MARDYARSKSRGHNSASGWMWLVIGLVIGLAVAGLMFLKKHESSQRRYVEHEHAKKPHEKQKQNATTSSAHAQPQFDFYTMLPKMQVNGVANTATSETKPITTPAKAPNPPLVQLPKPTLSPDLPSASSASAQKAKPPATTTTTKPEKYALQIASVRNTADLDSLKAQLSMLGYDVMVKPFKNGNITLHRVMVGPYKSRSEAIKQQAQLRTNKISSVITKYPQ